LLIKLVEMTNKTKKTVPDTSVLIGGKISELITKGKLAGEVLIPETVISELENQANKGQEIGFEGMEELSRLKELDAKGKIKLIYCGSRPTPEEIKAARFGALDAKIREVATEKGATLLTGDYVQYLAATARGIEAEHLETKLRGVPKIADFFDKETMSVHFILGVSPKAKKGKPGKVRLVEIRKNPCDEKELNLLARDIIDYGRQNQSIEINERGATVVQIDEYRIAIAEPPFSKAMEITAVRPIAKVDLKAYKLSDKLRKRLDEKAEGIFICGPPGAGKSSFAAALAEEYRKKKNAIVKTMESPRDLQVSDEITQYGPLNGSMEKTADVLLLVRPDYTVYDEVRKSSDFRIFADMRLSGVGMIGVTHSASPLDAIQRLVQRIDLGQLPLIVDTIIFVKDAEIRKVYETKMSVKVPKGMMEADLARPVVEVRDFETGKVEYEIYTFGDQKVIMGSGDAPEQIEAEVRQGRGEYVLEFGADVRGKKVDIKAGKNFLFKTEFNNYTEVRVNRKGARGKKVARALKYGDRVFAVVK